MIWWMWIVLYFVGSCVSAFLLGVIGIRDSEESISTDILVAGTIFWPVFLIVSLSYEAYKLGDNIRLRELIKNAKDKV